MANIKTYKDGARLIIVVENCTGPMAEKVNNFLLDILGTAQPKEVPAVIPIEETEDIAPEIRVEDEIGPENPTPFTAPSPEEIARACAVTGASGTLGRAIDTGDTAAVVRLSTVAYKLDESLKCTVLALCKRYMLDDCVCREPENASADEIKRFVLDYYPLVKGNVAEILNKAGYADPDAFFKHANMVQKQGAYQSILDGLLGRIRN